MPHKFSKLCRASTAWFQMSCHSRADTYNDVFFKRVPLNPCIVSPHQKKIAGSQAVLASQQFKSSKDNETESELLSSWSSPEVEESDTDIGAVGGYSSPRKSWFFGNTIPTESAQQGF